MKNILKIFILLLSITAISSCKKYLDINSDPDTPQFPDASSVFPTQLAAIPRGLQYDSRYCGRFIQNWLSYSPTLSSTNVNWDKMGYVSASDADGDIWRQVYFGLGRNLNYIIENGTTKKQWDYVGAAYALKALMFQMCTDYHGDIIYNDAFKENVAFFKYDDQQTVYKGVDSLCRLALYNLSRTDISTSASKLSKGDYVYGGNTSNWIKFTNGILARNFHRITNKSTYNADSVIFYCNNSLATVSDDFLIPFDASKNDDANFFGTYRDNLTTFRQSNYIVKLLDGTTLTGVPATSATAINRDPRLKHMLSCSQDTTNGNGGFRGVDPIVSDIYQSTTTGANARKRVAVPWADSVYANPSASVFSSQYKKYLFANNAVLPIMTASEIQFIKAEAAMRKGDNATAYTAYLSGINLHFDFINRGTFPRGNVALYNTNPISATDRAAYLASANVKSMANLRMYDILGQKYIALWGWGFFETFVDLRRYHYNDIDPVTGAQYYLNFVVPSPLAPENLNKPVYRVRPRYNSEYVWNRDELLRIGALNGDYHTYECWFSQP